VSAYPAVLPVTEPDRGKKNIILSAGVGWSYPAIMNRAHACIPDIKDPKVFFETSFVLLIGKHLASVPIKSSSYPILKTPTDKITE
jgi:hypothetical protein